MVVVGCSGDTALSFGGEPFGEINLRKSLRNEGNMLGDEKTTGVRVTRRGKALGPFIEMQRCTVLCDQDS